MSKKKQATDEMLREVLEKEVPEPQPESNFGSGIVESLDNIDQVINEFESGSKEEPHPNPQAAFDPFAARVKAIKLKLLAVKYKLFAGATQALFTEYHSVRSGHAPKLNEFLDALATLQGAAIDAINLELDTHKLSWNELKEVIDNPAQELSNVISSSEPPVVVPSSPSPVEEPLKDPSPTDPQPSSD